MKRLSVSGRRKAPSLKLSGLKTHEGGDAEKKPQRTLRTTTGRVFYSNLTVEGMSFPAALEAR
jgi:hypothetical protein